MDHSSLEFFNKVVNSVTRSRASLFYCSGDDGGNKKLLIRVLASVIGQ